MFLDPRLEGADRRGIGEAGEQERARGRAARVEPADRGLRYPHRGRVALGVEAVEEIEVRADDPKRGDTAGSFDRDPVAGHEARVQREAAFDDHLVVGAFPEPAAAVGEGSTDGGTSR